MSSILDKARSFLSKDPNEVFGRVKGVVHVGANTGQEIGLYDRFGLAVVWIEPIPDIFRQLQANLAGFPKQIALQGLVTDVENAEYDFHLANNGGESSSILELDHHKELWPDVKYEKSIRIRSHTLPSLLQFHNVDPRQYDMLVMDTQGAELMVLKGALPLLPGFTYIKAEVPDFESYKGCCQIKDLAAFLKEHGFTEYARHRFAKRRAVGNYYDIIYKKK